MATGPRDDFRRTRGQVAAVVLPLAVGLAAYWGVWCGVYVFDDRPAILENAPLQAGDWWQAALGPQHTPLANRPLTCLSLVADFRLWGPGPFGPHLGNLLLHLANAILLFATLRATLRTPNLAGRFDSGQATRLAAAVAALWVVHPLSVDAVAYATQRSTLLFSGCLLLALFATVRASASHRNGWWRLLVVLALAAGMASKEDMVVAPLLVVAFERAFLVPSWSLLRSRGPWYAGLAASWLVLVGCVAGGPSNPTVGFATRIPVTPFEWACTQAGVVVHYLRSCLWPSGLRGVYDWDVVRDIAPALLPGALVLALLAATVLLWRRRPWWGWLGSLLFLLLAPTSSVMPIISEVVAERRVYLPMLAVIVPVVFAAHDLVARVAGRWRRGVLLASAAVAVTGLTLATRARVAVYATEAAFWDDAYRKRDPSSRSYVAGILLANQGLALCHQGRVEEGSACYDEAMTCAVQTEAVVKLHAFSLVQRNRCAEAVRNLRRLVAAEDSDLAWGALGVCLTMEHQADRGGADDPRLDEAERAVRRQLASRPDEVQCWNALAYIATVRGRLAEAVDAYARVAERVPDDVASVFQRAQLLARLGRGAEIGPAFERLLAARPQDVALRLRLAQLGIQNRDPGTAERMLQDVLRLDPGNERAQAMLRELQAGRSR